MDQSELEKILAGMKDMPRPGPPADFTTRVLGRLAEVEPNMDRGVWGWLTRPHALGRGRAWSVSEAPGGEQYAWPLLLAGFWHLVLAAVLALGLRGLELDLPLEGWLNLQPLVILALGLWLFLFGFLAVQRREGTRRTVQAAIFGYVWFLMLNLGLLFFRFSHLFRDRPYFGLFVAVCLVSCLAAALGL
ncbi:MAG: hypothetical protein AB1896_13440, partial [Thermodesulfobacteriota bacterium]